MKRCSTNVVFAVVAVIVLSAGTATATTIVFDNLAASPPYYLNGGGIIGVAGNQTFITGTSFTPNATGQLDELTLGLYYGQGTNSVTLRLSPDVGGMPSTPIWQGSGPPAPAYLQLMTMTGIAGPTINSGQQYWIEALETTPGTLHFWNQNNQGDVGSIISGNVLYTNQQRYALRVGIAMVPEPGACLLLVGGCVGIGVLTKRRGRNGSHVSEQACKTNCNDGAVS
jgi:hypothetical protein